MPSCPHCGVPYEIEGTCTNPACPEAEAAATAFQSPILRQKATPAPSARRPGPLLEVPRPPLERRLGGSALEVFTLFLVELIGSLAMGFTFGVSGALSSLIDATYMALKDMGGGRYSFGKRAVSERVVDVATLERASNGKCFLRNLPYVLAWGLAVIPVIGDLVGWSLIGVLVLLDLILILATPTGRRLGDFIAGTQVVAEERNP